MKGEEPGSGVGRLLKRGFWGVRPEGWYKGGEGGCKVTLTPAAFCFFTNYHMENVVRTLT